MATASSKVARLIGHSWRPRGGGKAIQTRQRRPSALSLCQLTWIPAWPMWMEMTSRMVAKGGDGENQGKEKGAFPTLGSRGVMTRVPTGMIM